MSEQGPLQVRRDSRKNLETVSPAEGEMLISIDEVNEGVAHVGVSGGGPTGGVKVGLRNHDKATLKGTPGVERVSDQVSHVMALNNEWQVDGGGWQIPSENPSTTVKHWPIIQGKLPARTLNTGGWIDFHMDGWYRRPDLTPNSQDAIFIRLMVGNEYIGPDQWSLDDVGWGWPGQGDGIPNLAGDNGIDCDVFFDFNLRMRCISGQGAPITGGREAATYKWKLTGEVEVYAGSYNNLRKEDHSTNQTYDPTDGSGFERHVKLIREFAQQPDVNRTNVFRLEIGSPRSNNLTSYAPNDEIIVHNASMIAHGISRGRQIYRNDIGDFMAGSA